MYFDGPSFQFSRQQPWGQSNAVGRFFGWAWSRGIDGGTHGVKPQTSHSSGLLAYPRFNCGSQNRPQNRPPEGLIWGKQRERGGVWLL